MSISREAKLCDLCGRSDFEVLSRHDRVRRPLVTEVCLHCGLVAHQKIPSAAELADYYATKYRRAYHGEVSPGSRRVMRAWKTGERIYRQLTPWLTTRAAVLEVGAGIGCTVKVFEQQGHAAVGVEPNEGFQAYSSERLRAAVTRGSLFDLPPEPAHDLVLLVHVIEHFRSPRSALEHVHRMVKPGGLLYVECPNLGAVATANRMFHQAHIHNFTPQTLAALAANCGFEVKHWFVPPHAPELRVLLRRMSRPRRELPVDGYRQTLAALYRFGFFDYYCRWEYLAPRALDLLSRSWEWVAAPLFVQRLLRQCAAPPALPPMDRPHSHGRFRTPSQASSA